MRHRYLLDTNIVSQLIKAPNGLVAEHLRSIDATSVVTSIIVAAKLRFGAEKSGSARLQDRVRRILETLDILAIESPLENHYAAIRVYLESVGKPIGQNDLLIAAHALMLDLILVTDNESEFRRVPGLKIENWLRAEN